MKCILLFIIALKGSLGSCPRDVVYGKPCSGFGDCTTLGHCTCDSTHDGFDCSLGK